MIPYCPGPHELSVRPCIALQSDVMLVPPSDHLAALFRLPLTV
ncbi:unnamed protein product, partial [Staurois parvus]